MAISGGAVAERGDLRPSFDRLEDAHGMRVEDPIERRFFDVYTGGPVDPTPVEDDPFSAPIDRTVAIRTDELRVEQFCAGFVRSDAGGMIEELEQYSRSEHPAGTYTIELTAPVKVNVHVTAPLTVETGFSQMRFRFDGETEVLVGVRSYHKRPAATITTTADPVDMMRAVSSFGSALKTTTVERSYPTLRGHPPELELGDELSIPDVLERPDTGVRIEVPADLGHVFVVAPLAYYLGATVQPGPVPRLVTDTGFEHVLDGPDGFEDEVARVLKQVFFLDCITRTEGDYPFDMHERAAVEPLVDLEFEALYGRPLAEQLEAYLSVPFAVLEEHLPTWKLASHVAPEPANAETLPFLVDDLAVIRLPRSTPVSRKEAQSAALEDFMRTATTRSAADTRSTATAGAASALPDLVRPAELDSIEQAWVGEKAPLGASKAMVEAFRNRLGRDVSDGDVDITVVCNEMEMLEEQEVASGVYGSRDELPFDVTLYTELDRERLRFVLESDVDYLHYIGHVDEEGIQCVDGKLDIRELDSVGVDAFFLNACRSYQQGVALVDRGAIGGVVTLDDVLDSGALRVGETLARLLNTGFPLQAALEIARERSIVGGQYLVIGDGNADIAHPERMLPTLLDIQDRGGEFELNIETYPTKEGGMGTVYSPHAGSQAEAYLGAGTIGPFVEDRDQLGGLLRSEVRPVRLDGTICWSDTVDLDDF